MPAKGLICSIETYFPCNLPVNKGGGAHKLQVNTNWETSISVQCLYTLLQTIISECTCSKVHFAIHIPLAPAFSPKSCGFKFYTTRCLLVHDVCVENIWNILLWQNVNWMSIFRNSNKMYYATVCITASQISNATSESTEKFEIVCVG